MSASRLSRIVLLGTGPSTCVPNLGCLLGLRNNGPCPVCKEAHANPQSRNRRTNPSLLIQYKADEHAEVANIIIDCGKTFRNQIERFFPKFGVKSLRGVILTHDHADAVLGLDDLRDVQHYKHVTDSKTGAVTWQVDTPMQVFCADQTYNRIAAAFPYLTTGVSSAHAVPKAVKQEGVDEKLADLKLCNGSKEPLRHISQLDWCTVAQLDDTSLEEDPIFNACGLDIKPLRLHHGGSYLALGFLFGPPGSRVAYLSDTNGIPSKSMELLKAQPIDILVLDALFLKRKHTSHFSLPDSLDLVRELRPKRTYLTGMTHEFNYYEHNAMLAKLQSEEGLSVAMGYDGLHIDLQL
eukprot:m.96030 g.96030  ORF g.96030 m.96030 type:complete len:351 (-) comp15041_c0_seq2:1054-2106(-)